ncbi:hypothetical protein ARMGADRAFT_341298 [Armillaria gallica]|uniref:Uncharacterized protein n=1 Tax=Armillaria gallica TaxID=47427 RepID=A0A2H3DER0_ARMGA|nr:hypothetical protein ARMGADRAFT_341298 [Armillaria gallica]
MKVNCKRLALYLLDDREAASESKFLFQPPESLLFSLLGLWKGLLDFLRTRIGLRPVLQSQWARIIITVHTNHRYNRITLSHSIGGAYTVMVLIIVAVIVYSAYRCCIKRDLFKSSF